ncbi:helix-turn-helix transcriptional regulator [Thermocoleostomius sinensis]|uniref:AraC family transcriptional regulator n=1 Tax=Thermocoleostomius sinensis A174 TaxID=2016057 RepID=A0A9E8ZEB5_9CYAN|nr:AraC family transcriptional regulator [Thermocoleostomius sinensis]WAL60267.1 AraC family transcriptional regulator [Thermocoleostomius sinensis A174]
MSCIEASDDGFRPRQHLSATLLDYRQENASDQIVPKPAVLQSSGWTGLHFELHQQPAFATDTHQHTMHVLAGGLIGSSNRNAPGTRSLDGKRSRERRDANDIAIIPAGISHSCSWDVSAQFMVLAIEPILLQHMGQDWVNPDQIELRPQFMSESDAFIQGIFATLKAEAEIGGMGSFLLIDSLKTSLAIHLLRHYCATRPKLFQSSNGLSQAALTRVKDYINEHLHQVLNLSKIAAIAQLSPYHFLRLFKQRMGITPHQYILQCRLNRAKYLLQHSELSIVEIAAQTGFCDQSHLTRSCKRIMGMTPKQLMQWRSGSRNRVE